jgi:hypothetical protein
VRVLIEASRRIWDAHRAKNLYRLGSRSAAAETRTMRCHYLRNLSSDRHDGIERRHRILEDHRDFLPQEMTQLTSTCDKQIDSIKQGFPCDNLAGRP